MPTQAPLYFRVNLKIRDKSPSPSKISSPWVPKPAFVAGFGTYGWSNLIFFLRETSRRFRRCAIETSLQSERRISRHFCVHTSVNLYSFSLIIIRGDCAGSSCTEDCKSLQFIVIIEMTVCHTVVDTRLILREIFLVITSWNILRRIASANDRRPGNFDFREHDSHTDRHAHFIIRRKTGIATNSER